ncbi:DUF4174 domain-containing protein [Mycolicibacterium gilvum]|uniref:DUF4174 domain-containing protein n=1 Tax=Mycolicibacterium gilvum TaxID=1804 RepID=A0A378SUD6_9MYCO|nr:DUF4174 domain-containing protein [Mycolicibacterium gilvum]MCV7056621.1 DUF4174 domain-containing protein [Mycolicibacterium gilvum]STZ46373.1 Uncharacterised protein [Mycolicibacterium gilvum]
MTTIRGVRRLALTLVVLIVGAGVGSATASATGLDDHLWEHRPLLMFAPGETDPRLVETLRRIESSRCDFVSRDMVAGVVVREGDSTLDGQLLSAEESQQLAQRYAVEDTAFAVILIGKDGGEKLRVDEIPDLQTFYDLIDGMPMRSREMSADPGRC